MDSEDSIDFGSNRLIQKLNFLSDDIANISKKLDHQDDKFLTLFSQMTTLMRNVNKLQKKKRSRPKSTHSHAKKSTGKPKDGTDFSSLLHLQKALQQNITLFTRDLLFTPTFIPDKLLAEDCLSENEHQTICAKESHVDQIRMLIRKMKGRGLETINKFLKIIKEEFPHIEKSVRESYTKNVESSKQRSRCAICMMMSTVDPKDIADHLWEAGLIQDDLHGCIVESDGAVSRLALWNVVIQYLNQARDPDHAKNTLEESLKQKYDHLVQAFAEHKGQHGLLTCSCRPSRIYSGTSVGSQTDVSSGRGHWNVPNIVMESNTASESETFPSIDSKGEPLLSSSSGFSDLQSVEKKYVKLATEKSTAQFDGGDTHAQFGGGDAPISPDSTVPDNTHMLQGADNRSRHSSGKFQPQDNEHFQSGQFPSLPFVDSTEINRTSLEGFSPDGKSEDVNKEFATPTLNLGAGDNVVSSSTDGAPLSSDNTITPDTEKHVSLHSGSTTDISDQKRRSSDQGKLSPDVFLPKFRLNPPRSQVYRKASSSTDGDDEDDYQINQDHIYQRTRHKKDKKKPLLRQLSAPADCELQVLTNPRSPSEAKVGTRQQLPRTKKAARKRLDRRMRSNKKKVEHFWNPDKSEPTSTVPAALASVVPAEHSQEPGIPYNPSWSHQPQPRQTGKWDNRSGRTYWRMAQLQAAAANAGQFYSDSDLMTEDGEDSWQRDDNTV